MPAARRFQTSARRVPRTPWTSDAELLISSDERNAYYAARRLAVHSHDMRDTRGYIHWSIVAAVIARRSSVAEMRADVIEDIVAEEADDLEPFDQDDDA